MASSNYILCVDDDEDDCYFLREAVKEINNQIRAEYLHSGELAVQFLRNALETNNLPGLIVLAVNMPKLDGKETFLIIREILPDNLPILFLSTAPSDKDLDFGKEHDMPIFSKPTSVSGYKELAGFILKTYFQKELSTNSAEGVN